MMAWHGTTLLDFSRRAAEIGYVCWHELTKQRPLSGGDMNGADLKNDRKPEWISREEKSTLFSDNCDQWLTQIVTKAPKFWADLRELIYFYFFVLLFGGYCHTPRSRVVINWRELRHRRPCPWSRPGCRRCSLSRCWPPSSTTVSSCHLWSCAGKSPSARPGLASCCTSPCIRASGGSCHSWLWPTPSEPIAESHQIRTWIKNNLIVHFSALYTWIS